MADVPGQSILNEAALKRLDPYVKKVIDTAKFVALYTFKLKENKWEKTGVEGSLFVYSRTGEPFYNILVLNRLSTTNLIEPISSKLTLQLHEPFLLYLNAKCCLYGLWFYEKEECVRLASLIEKLMKELSEKKNNASDVKIRKDSHVDIFNMLSTAQKAYNNSKCNVNKDAGDDNTNNNGNSCDNDGGDDDDYDDDDDDDVVDVDDDDDNNNNDIHYNKNNNGNRKLTQQEMEQTPQSVVDFFAKAGSAPKNSTAKSPKLNGSEFLLEEDEADKIHRNPLIHQLMSNPVHLVEHIEKQQRLITPQREKSNDLVLKNFLQKSKHLNKSHDEYIKENCANAMALNGCPPLSPLPSLIPQQVSDNMAFQYFHDANNVEMSRKPTLIPPAMFTQKNRNDLHCSNASFSTDFKLEPLTRNQLFQAINYLLQNDPIFMTKIHEAYIKSLTK